MENQPTTSNTPGRHRAHMPSPPEHVAAFDAMCERTRAVVHRKTITADAASFAVAALLAEHAPDLALPQSLVAALERWETTQGALKAAHAADRDARQAAAS